MHGVGRTCHSVTRHGRRPTRIGGGHGPRRCCASLSIMRPPPRRLTRRPAPNAWPCSRFKTPTSPSAMSRCSTGELRARARRAAGADRAQRRGQVLAAADRGCDRSARRRRTAADSRFARTPRGAGAAVRSSGDGVRLGRRWRRRGARAARGLRTHAPGTDLDTLQTRIETLGAWTWGQRVQTTLAQLHLDGARRIGELSGGSVKRVALALALVAAARRAAARRADQPPRPRFDRLARGAAADFPGR